MLQAFYMAVHQFAALFITEMKAGTFTITPVLALLAIASTSPAAVTHDLVTVLPYVPKVILVDVTLNVVTAKAGAGGNIAIGKHRTDVYAGTAEEGIIAGFLFVAAQEPFATIVDIDSALHLGFADKVKDLLELVIRQLEDGIVGGALILG